VRQRLQWLHGRGITYEQLGEATGRTGDYVGKVAAGQKPGTSLGPGIARIYRTVRQRKDPLSRPLPNVLAEAPRREQRVRQPEVRVTAEQRVYVGRERKTGQFHAYKTLRARIERAARRGERVRLTTNWKTGQWMGKRGGAPHGRQQYRLWDDGIGAAEALEQLDGAGWDRDPEGALAALVRDMTQESETFLRVEGFSSYSLQIYTRPQSGAIDAGSEWAAD
jgi:hypothetical protein